jgi:hypothetical protein
LKGVDDDVRCFACTRPAQRLTDCERGASVRESDFDYGVSIVRDQYVTQIVAIFSRQCDTFEISFKRPAALGSNRMMLGADGGDAVTLWSHCVKQMQ